MLSAMQGCPWMGPRAVGIFSFRRWGAGATARLGVGGPAAAAGAGLLAFREPWLLGSLLREQGGGGGAPPAGSS